MDIVFMGTPDFSVPSLKKLAEDNRIEIKGVVTQPDRKRGRGQQLQASPVKKTALIYDLRVLQSANVNQKEFVERLEELAPEAIV
ncbi:MAG: formyltransferase family protein, partial [Bacillota bacterium]